MPVRPTPPDNNYYSSRTNENKRFLKDKKKKQQGFHTTLPSAPNQCIFTPNLFFTSGNHLPSFP
jgi:hypothetical protein